MLIVVVGLEQPMGSTLEKLLQNAMIKQYFTWRRYFHSIILKKFVLEGMSKNVIELSTIFRTCSVEKRSCD